MKKYIFILVCMIVLVLDVISPFTVYATEGGVSSADKTYTLGKTVNAGKDTGYSQSIVITEKDPHFNWTLGEFYVSGYTSDTADDNGNIVFLKNVGDKVTLWFELLQDIDRLGGDEALSIHADTNGYDEHFGVEKTDFGRGTLIIRQKGSDNKWGEPQIYTDYLSAKAALGASTQVELFEEGDYEVALNYEIKNVRAGLFGYDIFSTYTDYRIHFSFSVRNGNCMIYPFDAVTGAELTNSSVTENGFYLDLANSKYLDINVKKEVLVEKEEGLTLDVRYNNPVKEGEQYTDEGIYTVTAHNRYTDQQTEKRIYVGTNKILKAHVLSGHSIEEIERQLSLGAKITEKGELIPAETSTEMQTDEGPSALPIIIAAVIVILIASAVLFFILRNR